MDYSKMKEGVYVDVSGRSVPGHGPNVYWSNKGAEQGQPYHTVLTLGFFVVKNGCHCRWSTGSRFRHKKMEIVFRHKRTGDTMLFRITGRDKFYQNGEEVGESETLSEFQRLLGKENGVKALDRAKFRLILS